MTVAAPVTIRTDRGTVTVSPTAIARSLVLTADPTGRPFGSVGRSGDGAAQRRRGTQ